MDIIEPSLVRGAWRTLEPLHGMIYFVPEAAAAYAAVGVHGRSGYFASRAAAMGEVSADVVIATFYNFEPSLVRAAMSGVWAACSPSDLVAARLDAVDIVLRRALGDLVDSAEMVEAARLARLAAESIADQCVGRPLAAGHASQPWASAAHLQLWQAQTVLREYRGDGHICALVAAGIDGCEALVMHAATGQVPRAALQVTRVWGDAAWDAAVERFAGRGLVTAEGEFTGDGRVIRDEIETLTDTLATPAYRALGTDGCQRLRELTRPFSKAIIAAGLLPF
jgi:hypothetical protein